MPPAPPARAIAPGLAFALAALVLGSCGGGGGDSTSAALPAGCHEAHKPPPKHVNLKPPHSRVKPSQSLVAAVDTSCGRFEIALDTRDSPKTVNSFVYLARKGVYANTIFHRIVPDFVIQGGDPLGTGTGGPGYSVDEPPPANIDYRRGTVAMAKSQAEPPGRSGSQFFVVVGGRRRPASRLRAARQGELGSGRRRSDLEARRPGQRRHGHAARDRGDPEDRGRQGLGGGADRGRRHAPRISSFAEPVTAPSGSATTGAAGSCSPSIRATSPRCAPGSSAPTATRPTGWTSLTPRCSACPRNRSTPTSASGPGTASPCRCSPTPSGP